MKITNFLVCEFANSEPTGKVNLIGAGVDRVYARTFPLRVMLYLYLRGVPDLNDLPGYKLGRIKLMGDDGLYWDRPIQMLFTEEKPACSLISSYFFRFTAPGRYRLEASMEGTPGSVMWPIQASPVSAPPASPN
jgi:hypothetical protein